MQVGFVVNKVALNPVCLQELWFIPASDFTWAPHSLITTSEVWHKSNLPAHITPSVGVSTLMCQLVRLRVKKLT